MPAVDRTRAASTRDDQLRELMEQRTEQLAEIEALLEALEWRARQVEQLMVQFDELAGGTRTLRVTGGVRLRLRSQVRAAIAARAAHVLGDTAGAQASMLDAAASLESIGAADVEVVEQSIQVHAARGL